MVLKVKQRENITWFLEMELDVEFTRL